MRNVNKGVKIKPELSSLVMLQLENPNMFVIEENNFTIY